MTYGDYLRAKTRIVTLDKEIDELFGSDKEDDFEKARELELELDELKRYVDAGAMVWDKKAVKPLPKPAKSAEPRATKSQVTAVVTKVDGSFQIGAVVMWESTKREQRAGEPKNKVGQVVKVGHFIKVNYDGRTQNIAPKWLTLVA